MAKAESNDELRARKLSISVGKRHLDMLDKLREERSVSEHLRILIEEAYYRKLGAKV